MLSSSRAVSPSPAMSAAIASRRRPSRIASAIRGSSSTINTRMLRCYEPAHIVGISKNAYVLATPGCLDWRRGLQQASTNSVLPDPDSQDPRDRPGGRHRGDRLSPRLPVDGVLVLDGVFALDAVLALDGVLAFRDRTTHRPPSQ